jgi:hypothetical protein
VHLIVYTSEYIGDEQNINTVLDAITTSAKVRNPNLKITGLLFYHQPRFLQIIEGPKDSLDQMMQIINRDRRHKNIERLISEAIPERKFNDWNMDSINLSNNESLDLAELVLIRDVYKQNLQVNTDAIADFYKAMLQSHALISQVSQ